MHFPGGSPGPIQQQEDMTTMELTEDQATKLAALLDNTDDLLRVRYGPKPHQTLAIVTASALLSTLAREAPNTFGGYLRKVILAELNGQR